MFTEVLVTCENNYHYFVAHNFTLVYEWGNCIISIRVVSHVARSDTPNITSVVSRLARSDTVSGMSIGFKVHTRAVPVVISNGLRAR